MASPIVLDGIQSSQAQPRYRDEDEGEDTTLLNHSVDEIQYGNLDQDPSPPKRHAWLTGAVNTRNRLRWLQSGWISLVALILLCAFLGSENYQHGTTRLSALFYEPTPQCQDPYAMPGFLLHDNRAATARWIPYTDSILMSNATPATLPSFRNDAHVDEEVLSLSPPSFATKLKNRKTGLSAENSELDFLRHKTILLLGCSLDRFFMESFCRLHRGTFHNIEDGWHGMFTCNIPDVDLQIQLWFTYGALSGHRPATSHGEIRNFEDRVRDYWIPEAQKRNLTTVPDMIIWASGTWDVLGLRMKYAEKKEHWVEQAISWQELVWHRQRMHQIVSFIRTQWPDVPTMYRPPTYTYKKDIPSQNGYLRGVKINDLDQINEAIWRLQQSADAVMQTEDMPIFRWAEKLVGNNQFSDTMHYRGDGYAQWLYAEMMLYYLHYYGMANPTHCSKSSDFKSSTR